MDILIGVVVAVLVYLAKDLIGRELTTQRYIRAVWTIVEGSKRHSSSSLEMLELLSDPDNTFPWVTRREPGLDNLLMQLTSLNPSRAGLYIRLLDARAALDESSSTMKSALTRVFEGKTEHDREIALHALCREMPMNNQLAKAEAEAILSLLDGAVPYVHALGETREGAIRRQVEDYRDALPTERSLDDKTKAMFAARFEALDSAHTE